MSNVFSEIISFIKNIYKDKDIIPLHEPTFKGNEEKYVLDTIKSTFVSSVGEYVNLLEKKISAFTGMKGAVATVNGTQALYLALKISDVQPNDEVITQPLTFVATANAISYTGAFPIFLDVDKNTLGLSATELLNFIENDCEKTGGVLLNKKTKRKIKAVVPMHTFGHPCEIEKIAAICEKYDLSLIEDAAESLGSYYNSKHTGSFGKIGILSFNGNKTITTGGGGMLVTNDLNLAAKAKHLSTTAKVAHPYEFIHDETGYNFRMPNINAALGVAQMEYIDEILENKRKIAMQYKEFFKNIKGVQFVDEPENTKSNFWLNTILFNDPDDKINFLKTCIENKIMARSIWRPMHLLDMYKENYKNSLINTEFLYNSGVNLPSTPVFTS
ncbi:MAG: LegC family aminotransferase [Spirochaetia bacterium]|nr:LegC family aminotransferase [Spirochaetia bacterium]